MSRYGQTGSKDIATDARRLRPLLAALGGVDTYKVKVSTDDTTPDYLEQKFSSIDTSVEITVKNAGANEVVDFSVATYVADEIATHTGDADAHHNQVHVLATTAGLGADHTVSGLTSGQVLRASGTTTAAFAVLQHDDLGGVGADDHHNQSHVLASTSGLGADHTVAGLTAGQVLRATGATTAAFAALQATDLPAHVLATNLALGSQHTISGATAGHVLRATGATTAAIAQLQHSDLGSVGANDHHNQSHVLASTSGLGADHTVSGLTAGQVLRATGATTAAFASIQATDLPTGATLSVSSTNSGNSHAITTSDAVTTATAVILATSSSGWLTLLGMGIGSAEGADNAVVMTDNGWIGLGSGAGRIEFDNQTNDEINFKDCFVGINTDTPTALLHIVTDTATVPTCVLDAGSNGELATSSGTAFRAGHWDSGTSTFTERWQYDDVGAFLIGETAKGGFATVGLIINQAGNNDNIQEWRSSSVAHGMTSIATTVTYGRARKFSSTNGGLQLQGFSADVEGLALYGTATNEDTTDAGTSSGAVTVRAWKKSGTTQAALSNTANAFVAMNGNTARLVLKGNGDLHLTNTSLTALDDEDDLQIARALQIEISNGHGIKPLPMDDKLIYSRADLEQMGILCGDFTSVQGAFNALLGAVVQLGARVMTLEAG